MDHRVCEVYDTAAWTVADDTADAAVSDHHTPGHETPDVNVTIAWLSQSSGRLVTDECLARDLGEVLDTAVNDWDAALRLKQLALRYARESRASVDHWLETFQTLNMGTHYRVWVWMTDNGCNADTGHRLERIQQRGYLL